MTNRGDAGSPEGQRELAELSITDRLCNVKSQTENRCLAVFVLSGRHHRDTGWVHFAQILKHFFSQICAPQRLKSTLV
jgi:hypothetical protein